MILIAPVSSWITKKMGAIQKVNMQNKDQRTKLVNEILNGIRVIKFFSWEDSSLEKSRKLERKNWLL